MRTYACRRGGLGWCWWLWKMEGMNPSPFEYQEGVLNLTFWLNYFY